jgi:hypothetical protein
MNVTSSSLVYDNDDGDNGSNCGMDVVDTNSGSTMTSSYHYSYVTILYYHRYNTVIADYNNDWTYEYASVIIMSFVDVIL